MLDAMALQGDPLGRSCASHVDGVGQADGRRPIGSGTLALMTSTHANATRPGLLTGVWVFERRTFADNRGFFREAFRLDEVEAAVNRPVRFVQMNHSRSSRDTLRGLHAENWDKLVYVAAGSVFTALADVRPDSPTFARTETYGLGAESPLALFIPAGVAHGYCVLSEQADYVYQVTAYYDGSDRRAIAWNDPDLAVAWPVRQPVLSERDMTAPRLRDVFPERFNAR
ncbi:MAG: dTDP-4-dehydrorhamnose 3,5-epimerase family protein [Chloroflexi bacterium]|nr:dTDP-4-dehydrorhamnose 3,5-epimerase family protein [Chloroflexota bacterium]